MVIEEMKVEDTEQALTEAVCSRVREQLGSVDADLAEAFARQLYRWVAVEDVAERDPLDLYGLALGHFNFARERAPGTPKVRVYNPRFEDNGWQSTHTAVEIVTDDMPFLIDSVSMELNRRGFGVHLIIHPVLGVRRGDDGELLEILPQPPTDKPEPGVLAESVIHAEVARQTDPAKLHELELHLERVIAEVRAAVEDWAAMRSQALDVAADLRERSPARERRGRGGDGGLPRVAGGAQLHLPRLPRVRRRRPPGPRPRHPARTPGGRGRRPVARAAPAHAHEGELARHRAPAVVPRLRGREALRRGRERDRGAALPRALHTHGVPRQPDRDPHPAAQDRHGPRARGLPPRQPQREGAARDPRHLPARRAVPDLDGRAVRGGDGDPSPRRAPAAAVVRAARPVRPLLLDARVRTARPLQH